MAESEKTKDIWDKIASITPLLLGVAVTGVAVLFTQIYNYRQLQLNQITALANLRPLLTSDKPAEREFGYDSFVALGYENIAIRIIQLKKDESGRSVLTELKKSAPPQTQSQATEALKTLDQARKLVHIFEFGNATADEDPATLNAYNSGALWSTTAAKELGISSKLGVAVLFDTAVQLGDGKASQLQEATSKVVSPPLNTRDKEKAWLNEYLNLHDTANQRLPYPQFYPGWKRRTDKIRGLIRDGDWDLQTIANP